MDNTLTRQTKVLRAMRDVMAATLPKGNEPIHNRMVAIEGRMVMLSCMVDAELNRLEVRGEITQL